MKLLHGRKYAAEIRLGMFESLAPNDTIAEKLTAAGFISVNVTGSGRQRHAEGTWSGGDTDADLPSQVSSVRAL